MRTRGARSRRASKGARALWEAVWRAPEAHPSWSKNYTHVWAREQAIISALHYFPTRMFSVPSESDL